MKPTSKTGNQPAKRTASAPHSAANGKAEQPDFRPPAIELAKLAAIIEPTAEPGPAMTRSMETAMKFYVEALRYSSQLPKDLVGLVSRFGSDDRSEVDRYREELVRRLKSKDREREEMDRQREEMDRQMDRKLKPLMDKLWNETFTMEEARQFVSDNLSIKTVPGLLELLRRYWNWRKDSIDMRESIDVIIAEIEQTKTVPKFLLKRAVKWEMARLRAQATAAARVRRAKKPSSES